MSCPAEETIALYVGGDLEPAAAAALERHLAACAECAALAQALESDRELLASPPPELAAFPGVALACTPRSKPYAALIAAAALVAAGLFMRDRSREIPPPPPVAAHFEAPPVRMPAVAPHPMQRRIRTAARRPEFPVPPDAFRVPTKDPDVVIIWFAETKGDPQ